MTRRELILAAGSALVFKGDVTKALLACDFLASKDPLETAQDELYWGKVREAFQIPSDFLYLNHGGICPTSVSVLNSVVGHMRTANSAPAYEIYRKQENSLEAVRRRLAKLFICDAEELAIMPNASQGLFTAILGVHAGKDDLIVCTDQEYPRIVTAMNQRSERDGVRFEQVQIPPVPESKQQIIDVFAPILLRKPKIICLPRVGFLNGTVFPTAEIAAMARAAGALVLVDGAHAIGQMSETPKSTGCDLYACCLHKWLLGPLGTGFLYVRKGLIKDVWPLYPADAYLETDIRKFEQFGTRNTGIPLAIEQALDAHEAIGTERKAARLQYLRHYWTEKLRGVQGISFQSSLDPNLSSVLTTFAIKAVKSNSLADWLFKKHRIFVTSVHFGAIDGIRVSAQIFTTLGELDRLVAAITEAARDGIG